MISKEAFVKEWQLKAKQDFSTATILLKTKSAPKEIIAFHCQQAIEKYLKSFLFMKEITIPKTHDLDLLYQLCLKSNNSFKIFDRNMISELTDYAVDTRYPGKTYVPSKEELNTYIKLVKQIKAFVEKITK